MKKLIFSLLCLTSFTALFAQPVTDQNPNYEISRTRYMAAKDSLLGSQSSTVQNTYQAYDWMQLQQDRRDTRFNNRQQRRLNRSMYDGFFGYDNAYPHGYYNNRYNRYNNNYRNNYYPYRSYYNNRSPRISSIWWWLLF